MRTPEERPVVLNVLYNILARAFKIVVRGSPMADAATLFRSTDRKDFDDLQRSLLLGPPTEPFHCMCIGSPALYLYGPGDELVELTNHHGLSVRCGRATYVSTTPRNGCRGSIAAGYLVQGKNLRKCAHRKKGPSATGING